MAVSGDLRVSATMAFYPFMHHHLGNSLLPSKVIFKGLNGGLSTNSRVLSNWPFIDLEANNLKCHYHQSFGISGNNNLSPEPATKETKNLILNAVNMNFFERLNLAWKILFPSPTMKRNSNANIAKQRLKMILFSDRCAVSDEAKQKIVSNIVGALSDFVEIDSQDKVQLSVSTDTDLGTVYSVTVPVRRVKPECQDVDEHGAITNVEYKETREGSGSVDIRFDFFIPDKNSR
ncbi:Septum formation topological specificity factor [Parasponia andersonii]|uniref:Septum formation topological specificity factor n=1 Tax=Parasponia andersonii TaxID=3476 RepID=A0A2P5CY67_PARAD|nr:Septum formation topological specificity factor [Parasponia andersonii]